MHAKSDSYTLSGRSAALSYPKHGRRRMPAPMRSPCTYTNAYIYNGYLAPVYVRVYFGHPFLQYTTTVLV